MAKAAKPKVVKAKGTKAKQPRMSKGVQHPWGVWSLWLPYCCETPEKFHTLYQDFKTEKQAEAYIKKNPGLIAPVIRHVDIEPMEY